MIYHYYAHLKIDTIDGIIDVKCDITLHRMLMHAMILSRFYHARNLVANLGIIKTYARQKFSLSSPRMSGTAARWVSFARHLGQPHSRKCTNGAPIPFPPVSVRFNEFRRCLKADDGFIPCWLYVRATRYGQVAYPYKLSDTIYREKYLKIHYTKKKVHKN